MNPAKNPFTPQNVSELWDMLGSMMLAAPTFRDRTGIFPGRNIETEFEALNEGLKIIRTKVGEENYSKLVEISDRMRAHFEADPEDKTEEAIRGRECIHEMEEILKSLRRRAAKSDASKS